MDAISNSEANRISRAYSKSVHSPPIASDKANIAHSKVQLTDLSDLASRAANSGDEIRPEAIERAKALLSDPNWLNDDAIEGLAEKLLTTEDFTG
ncbi:MAG: hypothetical protein HN548_12120 [Opitutae bacterium]|jgi:hypothetical protein|nr:hypothetical protein [Opitutae bacterium]MBT5717130.1 hypothetical protein [Opitutae bacterium]